MCIIAIKPKNKPIFDDETIEMMYQRNPDGAGIMYLKPDGNVHIEKGFFSSKDVLNYVHAHPELNDTDVVMHFRIATSGKRDGLGCHPYPVWSRNIQTSANVSLAMCHNGILDSFGWRGTPEVNDTQIFIKECLRKLPHNFLRNRGIMDLLHKSTGTNKFAFLDKEGIHTIGDFIEDDGYLFSNSSYRTGKRLTVSDLASPAFTKAVKVLPVTPSVTTPAKQTAEADKSDLKQKSLAKLRLDGIEFDQKLKAGDYDKLSKWVIRFSTYVKQAANKDLIFEDENYRYVFKSKQNRIERSLKFNLKELQDVMDRYFDGFVGERTFKKELYDSLKEICEKLLRYDDSCSDEENAFYDDYYYYIFNDDELSVSRYSLSDEYDTEWF